MKPGRVATSMAALALTGLALGGCAASGSTAASPSPSASAVKHVGTGGMMVLAPLMVNFQDAGIATDYTLSMGRSLVFVPTDPASIADWTVASSPSGIVDFTAGGARDGATFNPGIQGVGDGTTTVTITNTKDNTSYTFTVTVQGASLAPGQVQNY